LAETMWAMGPKTSVGVVRARHGPRGATVANPATVSSWDDASYRPPVGGAAFFAATSAS
jgi:hypothetical protein